jgi:5'(3')-deoxyribonucleotidase
VTTWEIFESIGDDALRKRVYTAMNQPGFALERIRPYPGAEEAVDALRERAELYIVTSPFFSAAWMHDRLQWLDRELGIPNANVIFARHKHVVRGDVFVDDSPDHVRAWNGHWRACAGKGVLFDQHYNRADADLPRVKGLSQIVKLLS